MQYPPLSSQQMQRIDSTAIRELKIPSLELMENAGRKSAAIIFRGLKPEDKVAVFCGKGNNGGDGLVIARYLFNRKAKVGVFLLARRQDLKPDCLHNLLRFHSVGGKISRLTSLSAFDRIKPRLKNYSLIVDAIFGVGLKERLSPFYQAIIRGLNQSNRPIISVDVPSGLDATTGRDLGACIKAVKTITFTLPKRGFFRGEGPLHRGEIHTVDIGIPEKLIRETRFPIAKVIKILRKEVLRFTTPIVTKIGEKNRDPFLVLISCILSLRTKDAVTAEAAARLFKLADTPEKMLRLPRKIIEKTIYPVGFYRVKAKNILNISDDIMKRFNGNVPDKLEELLTLKGVGRKTANLVLTEGFNKLGVCVDTHVHRIPNRLGYIKTQTPFETEMALRKKLPKRFWIEYNTLLVAWGQNICKPVSSLCSICVVNKYCRKINVKTYR